MRKARRCGVLRSGFKPPHRARVLRRSSIHHPARPRRSMHTIKSSAKAIDALSRLLRGTVVRPEDPRFSIGRRVWNAAIDRHPAALVVCEDERTPPALRSRARARSVPRCARAAARKVEPRSAGPVLTASDPAARPVQCIGNRHRAPSGCTAAYPHRRQSRGRTLRTAASGHGRPGSAASEDS